MKKIQEKKKELEDIDTSLIIEGSRKRGSSISTDILMVSYILLHIYFLINRMHITLILCFLRLKIQQKYVVRISI